MTKPLQLENLADPFPLEDIEWRVSRAGISGSGVYCLVLAYITARAVQKRLDDVCGLENWRNEEPRMLEVNGKSAFACGISIRVDGEWITKWDVAEPTNVEPAKGGWSSASKRAGAQWSLGRYLYYLDETFAETADALPDKKDRRWKYAKLPEKQGGGVYYWKNPGLPAWALPKEPEHEVSKEEIDALKQAWRKKFAPDCRDPKELAEGFERFVHSIVGQFPVADDNYWIRNVLDQCRQRIDETTDVNAPDADVPFEA